MGQTVSPVKCCLSGRRYRPAPEFADANLSRVSPAGYAGGTGEICFPATFSFSCREMNNGDYGTYMGVSGTIPNSWGNMESLTFLCAPVPAVLPDVMFWFLATTGGRSGAACGCSFVIYYVTCLLFSTCPVAVCVGRAWWRAHCLYSLTFGCFRFEQVSQRHEPDRNDSGIFCKPSEHHLSPPPVEQADGHRAVICLPRTI